MPAVRCKGKASAWAIVGFVLLLMLIYMYSYSSSGDGWDDFDAQHNLGLKEDMFVNDHIDVPEIPVKEFIAEASLRDKKQKAKPMLAWHNHPDMSAKNLHNMDTDHVYAKEKSNILLGAKTHSTSDHSADDLQKFKTMLNTWPADKPKAAFYILTRVSRLKSLFHVLQSIDKYFNCRFHYPIILFHENELIPYISSVRRYTNSSLYFQQVKFATPTFLTQRVQFDIPCLSPVSYRHMCRFHAKSVYEHPIIQQLDYYWRLDDDSLLLNPIKYDVFSFMSTHQLHYGYSWIFYDSDSCVLGLWEATGRYIHERSITPCFFNQWPKPQLYYNNFEISSTKIWFSQAYKDYIEYLDQLGGIYYHRWGDAPIHGIAVSLFLHKNQTHQFSDIGYKHGSYIHKGTETKNTV